MEDGDQGRVKEGLASMALPVFVGRTTDFMQGNTSQARGPKEDCMLLVRHAERALWPEQPRVRLYLR
jgi:hypothetical protein